MDSKLHKQQIDNLIKGLLEVAKGNYSVQIVLSDENNDLDAIAIGFNMMIDSIHSNNSRINLLNEELLNSNKEKEKFFSIIAHDLQSPFNSVYAFSEILSEGVVEENSNAIKKYSAIIHESSKCAMDLLVNLTEWSLSKTGKIEFNPEYFEMAELINEVVLLLSYSAKLKSIIIKKELLPNTIVNADKNMMSTVLRNLISNAIKFTHFNGRITISTVLQHDKLIVSVGDNGIGITEDRIKKIFRLDENLSTPGTQNEKGTGLGVILCKEFIEKNRGEIMVKSEIGKGSTFSFTIPYNPLLVKQKEIKI